MNAAVSMTVTEMPTVTIVLGLIDVHAKLDFLEMEKPV